MSIRTISAILIAFALLLAPAVTRAGAASAAAPGGHMQMMGGAPCKMPPSGSDNHDQNAGKNCCVSMCMAVAIAPKETLLEKTAHSANPVQTVRTFRVGAPGELPTPPPRDA